jgi:hypothetical protein
MHCYLYTLLFENNGFQRLYLTKDNHRISVLHHEYSTIGKYTKKNGFLTPNEGKSSKHGRFDLAILDPRNINKMRLRELQVLIAVELALNAGSDHFKNDCMKISDKRNKVTQGYIAYFVQGPWDYFEQDKLRSEKECAKYPNIKACFEISNNT